MKYLDLKEIQFEEKEILKHTIKFLNENNINYYIWAGTYLGAVRHKGFIPWDDDIDIAIMRKDYDKMISILKENCKISDNLEVIGFELGKTDFPFLKVVNTSIMISEKEQVDQHLWIDIFPLDNAPKKDWLYFYIVKLYRKIHELRRYSYYGWKSTRKGIVGFFKKICIYVLKMHKNEKIVENFIKFCTKYNDRNTGFICNNVWGVGSRGKISIKELQNFEYDFDGIKVNGMKNYDKILTKLYGNYMQLPPEDKRQVHLLKAWKKEYEK